MESLTLGLIQGNFRNAFTEEHLELRKVSDYRKTMGPMDMDHNQSMLIELIREAVGKGAEFVLTPESYLDGWSCNEAILRQSATTMDGVYVRALMDLASELKVWICAGMFVKERDGIYNAAIVIDSHGAIAHIYRKTHETKDALKRMPYDLGGDLSVVDTPWGKIGVLICHDRWYPETHRTLRIKGAELILNPVATSKFWSGHPNYDIHRATLRSHAYGNSLFIASCNGLNHGGHSMVVAPNGTVICEGDLKQEVLLCKIDPSEYTGYDFVSLLNPDIYCFEKTEKEKAHGRHQRTRNRLEGG